QLMIALYRCGRQAEALAGYQSAGRVLVDELGIEPSPALQRVERAILEQDASLEPPPRAAPAVALGQAREERFSRIVAARRVRLAAAVGGSLALIAALLWAGSGPRASPVSAAPDTVAGFNARPARPASGGGRGWPARRVGPRGGP